MKFTDYALYVAINVLLKLPDASTVEDITKISQFGCRYFGGVIGMVSCNCTTEAGEMYIEPNSIPGYDTSTVEINHCPRVRFAPRSISDLRNLRKISLNAVASVYFDEGSINWYGYRDVVVAEERFDLTVPSLKVLLKDTTVEKISSRTFSGRINEISFEDVTVDDVEPFAFSNLMQTETLSFRYVTFNDLKPQAFKKLGTEYLTLDGVSVDLLPSRTFSNVTVYQKFSIINSDLKSVRSGGFFVHNPYVFEVINTRADFLDGEAFKVNARGDVTFRNNVFNDVHEGAFAGIRPNRPEATTIRFDSNTFSVLKVDSLRVVGFEAKFVDLNLNRTCECALVDELRPSGFFNDARCLSDDLKYVTLREYEKRMCSMVAGYTTVIVVTCVAVMAIGGALIGLYVYYKTGYLKKRYATDEAGKVPGKFNLIVPDGKTYKETEIHVILEKADLLTTEL